MKAGWILALAASLAVSARAGTPEGLAAWAAGDFTRAVAELRPPAQAGEAEAQFALGEAYRLGRGVKVEASAAIGWYRRAAAQGHARASDALGLMLFGQGQRQEAMPLLIPAAERGDPRALYLVATAHFNGDYAPKDWPRAYAMMTRAADAGIVQARQSLSTMNRYLSASDKARAQELMAAPLAATRLAAATPPAPAPAPAPKPPAKAPPPPPMRDSIPTPPPPPPAPDASTGTWRVQLGAFGSADRAEAAWADLVRRVADLRGVDHRVVPAGAVQRLQAFGLSRGAANQLCARVRAARGGCLVIGP